MIITIELASPSGSKLPSGLARISHDEVVLIELQGALEVDPNERDGTLVGKLKLDEAASKPTLMIGHHLLEGKVATLAKPLAVLRRCGTPTARSTHSDDAMACDEPLDGDHGPSTASGGDGGLGAGADGDRKWEIVAVVKKKILFAKRPMPIVKMRG